MPPLQNLVKDIHYKHNLSVSKDGRTAEHFKSRKRPQEGLHKNLLIPQQPVNLHPEPAPLDLGAVRVRIAQRREDAGEAQRPHRPDLDLAGELVVHRPGGRVVEEARGEELVGDPGAERGREEALQRGGALPAGPVPEPGSGRLKAVGPDKLAKSKLTYRLLGSAFHDGAKTGVADLLYAYMFAYRWGVQNDRHYDPSVDSATAPLRRQLAGLQFEVERVTQQAPEAIAVPSRPPSARSHHLSLRQAQSTAREGF